MWESLEALATICLRVNKYQQASAYIERAMNIFLINFQRKDTHKKSLIEKRLSIKMNRITELCGNSNLKTSKSLTSLNLLDDNYPLSNRDPMSQRSLQSRPSQQNVNLLDNLHSSSSADELEDSSDDNNTKDREIRTQTQPFGLQESIKIKSFESNITSTEKENQTPLSDRKQEVKSRISFNGNELDTNNHPTKKTEKSSLPSLFGPNRAQDTNRSRSIL